MPEYFQNTESNTILSLTENSEKFTRWSSKKKCLEDKYVIDDSDCLLTSSEYTVDTMRVPTGGEYRKVYSIRGLKSLENKNNNFQQVWMEHKNRLEHGIIHTF